MIGFRDSQRRRRHGLFVADAGRRHLERAGWRTTLEYRENHVRSLDGRLLAVEGEWLGEAEHEDGRVLSVCGPTPGDVWAALAARADTLVLTFC